LARALFRPGLDPALRDAFATEVALANQRRLRVLLPLVCVGHLLHTAVFWPSAAQRAALPARVLEWRQDVALVHGATLLVAAALAFVAFRRAAGRPSRLLGPATALTYLLHAAVVVGVDQLTVTSVTPFIGYCLGVAGVLFLEPLTTLAVFGLGLAVYVAGILTFQAIPQARLAVLPNGVSIAVLSVTLSMLLYAARRREFVQKTTIDEQQRQLAELNASLERRVSEQVGEIVARAAEVDSLNAQLRAQVRERSTELSLALAQLARQDRTAHLQRGTLLGHRFEIDRFLGEGGMGTVYAGLDRSTGGAVAIKVVQASSRQQLAALERFLREARSAAAVDHPAVVRMLHVDVSDGMLYQVQELVLGETLERWIRARADWTIGAAARIASVLSSALAAAHAQGVVHRDVKPANIMLTQEEPGLKLLDFGISKLYQDEEWAAGATLPGTVLGTPAYMSPEQIGGSASSDRMDVYAVGVILFTLLTGRHPFDDDPSRDMMGHHLMSTPPEVASIEPRVPPALSHLVEACLAKNPDHRPAAAELSLLLRAFADDTASLPPLVAKPQHAERTAVEGKRRFDLVSGAR
jgi:serine/threonine-protein kinase